VRRRVRPRKGTPPATKSLYHLMTAAPGYTGALGVGSLIEEAVVVFASKVHACMEWKLCGSVSHNVVIMVCDKRQHLAHYVRA
jgi:hypothetical protein